MNLFSEEIRDWDDWSRISDSIPVFSPLIQVIRERHGLPAEEIERAMPATNAIFKAGDYVYKIYAPAVSGVDGARDMENERRVAEGVRALGITVPQILAHGVLRDRYDLAYIVMESIDGMPFRLAKETMSDAVKVRVGQDLRAITERMNVPGLDFAPGNIGSWVEDQERWKKYSQEFQEERLRYVRTHEYGELVLVHGDLNGDNVLVGPDGALTLIDFAEAMQAPKVYEDALIAVELFDFDLAFLRGYFPDADAEALTRVAFDGLLIHDFGGDVIRRHLGDYEGIRSLGDLRQRLEDRFRELGR